MKITTYISQNKGTSLEEAIRSKLTSNFSFDGSFNGQNMEIQVFVLFDDGSYTITFLGEKNRPISPGLYEFTSKQKVYELLVTKLKEFGFKSSSPVQVVELLSEVSFDGSTETNDFNEVTTSGVDSETFKRTQEKYLKLITQGSLYSAKKLREKEGFTSAKLIVGIEKELNSAYKYFVTHMDPDVCKEIVEETGLNYDSVYQELRSQGKLV